MNDQLTYLGLGSNLGDRKKFLQKALQLLNQHRQIQLIQCSSLYETEPVGYLEQPSFYNMVVQIQTTLSAQHLLQEALWVEQQLHRERKERFGPRTIDIDILLYHEQVVNEENLQIPHPRMTERAFVLIPLQEIAPDLHIPGTNRPLAAYVNRISTKGVRQIGMLQ